MIVVTCRHCQARLKAKAELAGRNVRCPRCKTVVGIPHLPTDDTTLPPHPGAVVSEDVTATASCASVSSQEEPLTTEAHLRIQIEIARGGMGAIMRAVDEDIEREVAVKFLLNTADDRQKVRFFEEAKITGQLEHPNIVPIHQLGAHADGRCYFSMKLVKGRSLAEILKDAESTYTLSRLLTIFVSICNGMAYAHSRKVIHRDLKPANIMVGDFGEVYVMDWGLAKVLDKEEPSAPSTHMKLQDSAHATQKGDSAGSKSVDRVSTKRLSAGDLTQAGAIMGTPAYMPPEQAQGDYVDERADIYSLGAILYEILTLTPPVGRSGDMVAILMRVVEGQIEEPAKRAPNRTIPAEVSAIAMKALSKHRNDRYPTVEELHRDIKLFQEGRSVSAKYDTVREQLVKFVKRNKGFSFATAASLAVLTIVVGFFIKVNYDARVLAEQLKDKAEESQRNLVAEEKQKQTAIQHALPALGRFARQLAGEGRLDESQRQIELTLLYDAKNPEALLLQAQLLIAQERWAEGRAALDGYLEVQPGDLAAKKLRQLSAKGELDDPAVWFDVAKALQDQKLFAPATQLLQKVQKVAKAREPLVALYSKQVASQWPGRGVSIKPNGKLTFGQPDLNWIDHADLLPLKGIPLEEISIRYWRKLKDLEPLRGMPLTAISVLDSKELQNIEALRDMPLVSLNLSGCNSIQNIKPLQGLSLTELHLANCNVSDLSPLRGMPLTKLYLRSNSAVSDLQPLQGMPITDLLLYGCSAISDLEPLRGMPLNRLSLHGLGRVRSLEPLRGMPLVSLELYACSGLSSLEPLKGMSLTYLGLSVAGSGIKDLEPLRGMPLEALDVQQFSDVSPLEGMKLKQVVLDPKTNQKGLDGLRRMATLKIIMVKGTNYPAEEFWKRYDAGEFK